MKTHQFLPTLLFLLLLTTLTKPLQSHPIRTTLHPIAYEDPQQPNLCSSSCGSLTNITYPFRLSTDPPSCGDLSYELTCLNHQTPILSLHSTKFIVKQISYNSQTIRLLDPNLSNATCKLPPNSLYLNQFTNDPRYRGHVSNTYTNFFSCSSGTNLTDQSYRRVPCLSGNNESSGDEVYVSYDTYIISQLQGSCKFISRVPTIYQPVLYPSYESIVRLLEAGFDLGWSVDCKDCVDSGGTCTLRSWDTLFVYECHFPGNDISTLIGAIFYALCTVLLGINFTARFILAPIALIGFLVHKYMKKKKAVDMGEEKILFHQHPLVPRRYSYPEIVSITDHFKTKLGKGGFGTVYGGQLPDGNLVAVKMLDNFKIDDEDFINEVLTIGRIRHVNVLSLLGFCSDGSYHALVLEYMPNGSLDKYIFAKNVENCPLSWKKLFEIALGTAQGIEHLHGGSDVCILHIDIKPQNVLLDHNFVPKASDYGLAKFCPKEKDFVPIISARGTIGYIAPELLLSKPGTASCKSDVYSFGMLLLEMVKGKRNVDAKGKYPSEVYFPYWVYDHLSDGGDLELVNATEVEVATARKLCIVGLSCIQKEVSDRPTMAKVVEMLEGNVNDLQLPPNAWSFPQHSFSMEPHSDSSTKLLITKAGKESS